MNIHDIIEKAAKEQRDKLDYDILVSLFKNGIAHIPIEWTSEIGQGEGKASMTSKPSKYKMLCLADENGKLGIGRLPEEGERIKLTLFLGE